MIRNILLLLLTLGWLQSCLQPTTASGPVPESITYLARDAWGAKPPVLPMRSHTLRRLTIHHTGTPQVPGRTLEDKMRALQKFSQEESPLADGRMKKPWADIPYHLYVDVKGDVAEGRDLNYAGDSNTNYDPAGHLLVVVEGNFEKEQITPDQMKTLEILVPALAKRYNISADSLGGHKDFAQTSCPGNALYLQLGRFQKLMQGKRKH
ncbi:peptidoglycan recognition protein family protein [Pontibacter cellulosilyticus]|uniref:N-acetylmuramoyl-L-alanine amidase n=1 Tax=Pontibacter cellulosilyticus TaxID=1720253 RepID=A0A923SK41_9BACT|nr:peptidoglycan recognition family protein [Pontibacter cellulosilyticus]MBC5994478.1 N-acetylmuramoyl-L-alanine amidase [Pontibacter cellulosilyticus]